MEHFQEEAYQIATLVVVVITVLLCMCYLLIFVNPQIALNPLKPPLPTATAFALSLQPTWTPTRTSTPSPTATPTLTGTPTQIPSSTPMPSRTPTRAPTRRIPTRTPAPPTSPPTNYIYRVGSVQCSHSGGTFIEGEVWGNAGEQLSGIRVALSSGPATGDMYYVNSGSQGRSAGYFDHVIRSNGSAPGTYYVWIADSNARPLSDPNAARIVTNSKGGDDPTACWRAWIQFYRK